MSGDARPDACNSAAGDIGRGEILRQIKDNISISGQLSESSASSDPATESLLAFLSQRSLSGVNVGARYWERREESDSAGIRVLRVFCATKVAISKSLLKRQIRDAIDGAPGGNPEIRAKLQKAQESFFDNLAGGSSDGTAKTPKRVTGPTESAETADSMVEAQ
jgi:hypothetical protein